MEKIGRQRRSESAWRELVDRQEQSGLTVAQFCEREGIKSASLYGWRSRLRERLGHVETTQSYLDAHLALKGAALSKVAPMNRRAVGRHRPTDKLLQFLNTL